MKLKEEVTELKEQRDADHTLMAALRNRLVQLEAELRDYKEIAEQTCNVRDTHTLLLTPTHSLSYSLTLAH